MNTPHWLKDILEGTALGICLLLLTAGFAAIPVGAIIALMWAVKAIFL